MVWQDQDLLTEINPLCAYHKWTLRDGTRNPNADQATRYIFDLKDGPSATNYDAAVRFFSKKLLATFRKLEKVQYPTVVTIVPSSTKGKRSVGLCDVVDEVRTVLNPLGHKLKMAEGCLVRHTSAPKNATGGSREIEKHLKSISVDVSHFKNEDRILLLDDVSTTGNSIKACKFLLKQAGAGDVVMLVLGQTAIEDE